MMIELAATAIIIATAIATIRAATSMKRTVLNIQSRSAGDFFESAEKLLEFEGLTKEHTLQIASMASTLDSRKEQLILAEALRRLERERRKGEQKKPTELPSLRASLPEGAEKLWSRMLLDWMIAVSAQGSILGYSTIEKLLHYVDEPKEEFVREAEILADRALAH